MSFFGSKKTTIPATGLYALPQEYQDLYKSILGQSDDVLNPGGSLNSGAFTPSPINSGERSALDSIYQGFAPTAQSLKSDMSMLKNPYDESVIGGINREATGENSLVNQYATRAGQQGSNRSFLGASDVEQNRLNSIGQFKQSQYNNTIDQILRGLVPQRQADAQGALSAGAFERGLDMQTKQAPVNALNNSIGALGGLGQLGQGTPQQTVSSGGGLGGFLSAIAPIASLVAAPFTGGTSLLGMAGSALGKASPALGQATGSFFSSSPTGPYLPFGVR